ncbi:type II secretion system F family protein [Rhodosalinus sp. 5P4]|uniref:type II secretion system F family protein n=1 Tax=Rhodosalinus sp. 5P4 TaxID=3239196 RepID=UPI003526534B
MSQVLPALVMLDPFLLIVLGGIAVGSLLLVYGLGRAATERSPSAVRIEGTGRRQSAAATRSDFVKLARRDATGLAGALAPETMEERFQVQHALARAGFRGSKAVARFYAIRVGLGLGLPAVLIGLVALSRSPELWVPAVLADGLSGMSSLFLVQSLALLAAIGFFAPAIWLNRLVKQRRQAIEDAFPNALDLIQISVEAGMGFDAAMIRVAEEIHEVAPHLSEELLLAQSEIQAGRDRARALVDMGRRTGVDEVTSFVNVVLQSMQFGTSISDALTTYAEEMRMKRELKAQEKANKLPVQMSAVMALLMLPAIVSLTLGPVIIRYINYFAAG